MQGWSQWEDNCGQLRNMLYDVEASSGSEEAEEHDEKLAEQKLDVCQVNHVTMNTNILSSSSEKLKIKFIFF